MSIEHPNASNHNPVTQFKTAGGEQRVGDNERRFMRVDVAVPEGWCIAPYQPTTEQLFSARNAPMPALLLDSQRAWQNLQNATRYKAMLAAVVQPRFTVDVPVPDDLTAHEISNIAAIGLGASPACLADSLFMVHLGHIVCQALAVKRETGALSLEAIGDLWRDFYDLKNEDVPQ